MKGFVTIHPETEVPVNNVTIRNTNTPRCMILCCRIFFFLIIVIFLLLSVFFFQEMIIKNDGEGPKGRYGSMEMPQSES